MVAPTLTGHYQYPPAFLQQTIPCGHAMLDNDQLVPIGAHWCPVVVPSCGGERVGHAAAAGSWVPSQPRQHGPPSHHRSLSMQVCASLLLL